MFVNTIVDYYLITGRILLYLPSFLFMSTEESKKKNNNISNSIGEERFFGTKPKITTDTYFKSPF